MVSIEVQFCMRYSFVENTFLFEIWSWLRCEVWVIHGFNGNILLSELWSWLRYGFVWGMVLYEIWTWLKYCFVWNVILIETWVLCEIWFFVRHRFEPDALHWNVFILIYGFLYKSIHLSKRGDISQTKPVPSTQACLGQVWVFVQYGGGQNDLCTRTEFFKWIRFV